MTREMDCISRAKTCDYIAEFINHEYSTQPECEMIDAMIEGIQHLPSVKQEPCKDAVSRQAAIDAVEHITSNMSVCVNSDECHGMKRMQGMAVRALEKLPPAQPESEG